MNEKVSDSIKYLMNEYKRLANKKNKGVLTNAEKETLENLKKFLGKK
ncbi:MAG: hypothetical protein HOC10_04300 [Pelagibacteraceae bacterium]|jgi:hypothetical protein|nr:hypothetical protein [Pelagibacteraceae bacterium]